MSFMTAESDKEHRRRPAQSLSVLRNNKGYPLDRCPLAARTLGFLSPRVGSDQIALLEEFDNKTEGHRPSTEQQSISDPALSAHWFGAVCNNPQTGLTLTAARHPRRCFCLAISLPERWMSESSDGTVAPALGPVLVLDEASRRTAAATSVHALRASHHLQRPRAHPRRCHYPQHERNQLPDAV